MKLTKFFAICTAMLLVLSGCSSSSNPKLKAVKTNADLTQNGENEAIITSIKDADDGKAFVMVYTKLEDWTPMYQIFAGTDKEDYKGIYICKKGGSYYLLVWKPSFNDEAKTTTLEYVIMGLKYDSIEEKGKAVEIESDSVTFTDSQVEKDGDKYDEASQFVSKLNKYIEKSAALLDTVGGELVYSPDTDNKERKLYYPDWYDKDYKAKNNAVVQSSEPSDASSDVSSDSANSSATSDTSSDSSAESVSSQSASTSAGATSLDSTAS